MNDSSWEITRRSAMFPMNETTIHGTFLLANGDVLQVMFCQEYDAATHKIRVVLFRRVEVRYGSNEDEYCSIALERQTFYTEHKRRNIKSLLRFVQQFPAEELGSITQKDFDNIEATRKNLKECFKHHYKPLG